VPFAGRTALVTGAGSGMGQLSAWRLAADDVRVVAVDVDEEGLDRTARRAPQIESVVADVRDTARIDDLVRQVEHRHGPIERLVNAAAIAPAGSLAEQPLEEIRRVMEINYGGLVSVTKAVLPRMLERHRGDVIQFGSLAGWVPSQRLGAYSATKAAVVSFTETLAHELTGSGLRVVCVCPPVVDTPLLDQIKGRGPKSLEQQPKIRPEEVLDSIEHALDSGQLFAFPGRGTSTVWRVRRFLPSVLWRRIDSLESN
jgi:NAD(P)-dependent dehydrogenase (short-subunit alcohol dehydrogenase family)